MLLLTGVLFATGRRTVAAWLRGFGVGPNFQQYYYFLSTPGATSRTHRQLAS